MLRYGQTLHVTTEYPGHLFSQRQNDVNTLLTSDSLSLFDGQSADGKRMTYDNVLSTNKLGFSLPKRTREPSCDDWAMVKSNRPIAQVNPR